MSSPALIPSPYLWELVVWQLHSQPATRSSFFLFPLLKFFFFSFTIYLMKKGEVNGLSLEEIRALPKTELHVHLDCCLSFDVVSKLNPSITREDYQHRFIAPKKCKNLADFISRLNPGIELMQTKHALRLTTEDLFRQFQNDNVIYAEIRFAPLLHLKEGLTPDDVVNTVEETVAHMVEETGIDARIILCTLRHFTQEQSIRTAELVEDFRGTHVVAMDLAADEAGFPIDAHIKAFEFAYHRYLPCTAHAGEADGPKSIKETLKTLKPFRIGHGVRSIEDPKLVKKLKKEKIHLEICPSCNVQIDIFDSYENHPVDRLYREGLSVGINTDARTTSNITLSEEYERLQQVFRWGKFDFYTCNKNALAAAFLPDPVKETLTQKLIEGYESIGV